MENGEKLFDTFGNILKNAVMWNLIFSAMTCIVTIL